MNIHDGKGDHTHFYSNLYQLLCCRLSYIEHLYSKQCGPRSDCSIWSNLILVFTVCMQVQTKSDDISAAFSAGS